MAAISTGNINLGIKKSLNERLKDVSSQNCPNFRVDSYNSGVRFGSDSELTAIHINMKESRVLNAQLNNIKREKDIQRKGLDSDQYIATRTLDRMRKKSAVQRSHLPKDILYQFKRLDSEGKMPNPLKFKVFGPNSNRMIQLQNRLLYMSATSRLAKFTAVADDEKHLEKMESQRRQPVMRIYRPKTVRKNSGLRNESEDILLSRSECELIGDLEKSKDRVIVRNSGPTIRATTSLGYCKSQLLYPEFTITGALKVKEEDDKPKPFRYRPKTTASLLKPREAVESTVSEVCIRNHTEEFQPMNEHMSGVHIKVANTEFAPKSDQYTAKKSVFQSLKSKL